MSIALNICIVVFRCTLLIDSYLCLAIHTFFPGGQEFICAGGCGKDSTDTTNTTTTATLSAVGLPSYDPSYNNEFYLPDKDTDTKDSVERRITRDILYDKILSNTESISTHLTSYEGVRLDTGHNTGEAKQTEEEAEVAVRRCHGGANDGLEYGNEYSCLFKMYLIPICWRLSISSSSFAAGSVLYSSYTIFEYTSVIDCD